MHIGRCYRGDKNTPNATQRLVHEIAKEIFQIEDIQQKPEQPDHDAIKRALYLLSKALSEACEHVTSILPATLQSFGS